MAIVSNSRQYMEKGFIQFDKVLSIPTVGRIPNLTHVYGFQAIHKILTALLASFSNSLNLIRPMTEEQMVDCAMEMVMTTEEDLLSVEDYVLFFQGAKQGKYGKILDRMDQQTVFDMLEQYRSQRHVEYLKIKENKHLELKGLGPSERTNQPDPLSESLHNLTGRMGDLKEKLKEQREINRANRL